MAAGELRDPPQVLGIGQGLEHLDGGHDVVIDRLALLRRQSAAADVEIVDLLVAEKILLPAFLRPSIRGDLPHALLVLAGHLLDAEVAGLEKLALLVKALVLARESRLPRPLVERIAGFSRRNLRAQGADLGVAFENLEASRDEMDAIENGLELRRLVHDVFRRRDLAAVVQPARYLQLVAVVLRHPEVGERPMLRRGRGVGEHEGQLGHAPAMSAGVRRLVVDGCGDELDERLEEPSMLANEPFLSEHGRGLGGERQDELLVGLAKGKHGAVIGRQRVDQLDHADDLVLVVAKGNRQKGLRAVPRPRVEGPRAGEIELRRVIGVGHVDDLACEHGMCSYRLVARASVCVEQSNVG